MHLPREKHFSWLVQAPDLEQVSYKTLTRPWHQYVLEAASTHLTTKRSRGICKPWTSVALSCSWATKRRSDSLQLAQVQPKPCVSFGGRLLVCKGQYGHSLRVSVWHLPNVLKWSCGLAREARRGWHPLPCKQTPQCRERSRADLYHQEDWEQSLGFFYTDFSTDINEVCIKCVNDVK